MDEIESVGGSAISTSLSAAVFAALEVFPAPKNDIAFVDISPEFIRGDPVVKTRTS